METTIIILNSILNGIILVLMGFVFFAIIRHPAILRRQSIKSINILRLAFLLGMIFAFTQGFAGYFQDAPKQVNWSDVQWEIFVLLMLFFLIQSNVSIFKYDYSLTRVNAYLSKVTDLLTRDDVEADFTFDEIKSGSELNEWKQDGCIRYRLIEKLEDQIAFHIIWVETGAIGKNRKNCHEDITVVEGQVSNLETGRELMRLEPHYNAPGKYANIYGTKCSEIYLKLYV